MKKLLFILFFAITAQISSQEINLINVEYEENGICKKSFKVQVIDKHQYSGKVFLEITASIPGSIVPIFDERLTTYNTVPGGKAYTSPIIKTNGSFNYNSYIILAKKVRRNIKIRWTNEIKIFTCDQENLKLHQVKTLSTSLIGAANVECNNGPANRYSINLQVPNQLESGKVYYGKLRDDKNRYFKVISSSANANASAHYFSTSNIQGPYFLDCNDPDGNDNDNDTSDFDLQILESDVIVSSSCVSCPSILSDLNPGFLGGTFPVNNHILTTQGSYINTQFLVKNIGNTNSQPTKIEFYLSKDYNSIAGLRANNKTINVSTMNVNGQFIANPAFSISDFGPLELGNYYLVINVNYQNSNDSNTQNNYVSIPVKVISSVFGGGDGKDDPFVLSRFNESIRDYSINIYSFEGLYKTSFVVRNKEEEERKISNLPKGFYIVKKENQTYKIVVE